MQITSFTPAVINRQPSAGNKTSKDLGQVVDNLTVSPLTLGTDALDASMALAYTTKSFPEAFQNAGYVFGAAHLVAGAGYLVACCDQDDDTIKHRFAYAAGHALSGLGHIAGAAGAGMWAIAPIVGGMLACTLEDYRSRS